MPRNFLSVGVAIRPAVAEFFSGISHNVGTGLATATLEETSALYPHLSDEQALMRYQRFRLGMHWNHNSRLS